MDEAARDRLVEMAEAIEKFRRLHPAEQEWLYPLLNRNVRTALEILAAISGNMKSFEEIADLVGLHPHTVSQKLNALVEGGVSVDMTATGAKARTGRPRKLARR